MNYKPKNCEELVNIYLKKSAERLESAEALLKIKNFEDSISRSYYAILDAATACLIRKDIVPKSHAGAIKLFSLHYIKPQLVDKKYQRYFAKIEKARIEADYTHTRVFTEEEVMDVYQTAIEFLDMVKKLLKRSS